MKANLKAQDCIVKIIATTIQLLLGKAQVLSMECQEASKDCGSFGLPEPSALVADDLFSLPGI